MTESEAHSPSEFRTLPGAAVVLAMFAFGVVMTASLWLYWEAYTRPFRPLQEAIFAEFPGSSPRVVGGKVKSHQEDSPRLLRVIVQVDFDPNTADDLTIDDHLDRLTSLVDQHIDLNEYHELEIHLVNRVPQRETLFRTFRFPADSLSEEGRRVGNELPEVTEPIGDE